MIDSFYIAATGMGAQQLRIDTISNNISNVNTTGFKKGRVAFEDMFYRRLNPLTPLSPASTPDQVGLGTAIARTDTVFTAGDLVDTGQQLDMAIKGAGFFEVTDGAGGNYYSRVGSLRVDANGELLTQNGYKLTSTVRIPPDAIKLVVGSDGAVSATVPDEADPIELGRIELANFVNAAGLRPLGAGLYAVTDSSGEAFRATPGEDGLGTLSQGFVESSNVDLTSELLELVVAQRAYQLNSRVVQISDDILASIANLRR